MVRFFVGKVETVDETLHTITFSIEDFTGSQSIQLPAIPLVPSTVLPEQDDEIFVIQPDSDIEIFYYTLMPNPEEGSQKVELRYGTAYVRISKDEDKYTITSETSNGSNIILGDNRVSVNTEKVTVSLSGTNASISIDNGSSISMSSSEVLINGHLKVAK